MSDNTIILQGGFTSTGLRTPIVLRSDVGWMEVFNWSQIGDQQAEGRGVRFSWFRGMAAGDGLAMQKTNNTDALNYVITNAGFTLFDSSVQSQSAVNATVTAVTGANPPIVDLTDTTGLSAGDVISFINVTGGQQLGGIWMTIDTIVANTSFRLPFMPAIAAATNGSFRKINFPPNFVPPYIPITKISNAVQAVVTLSWQQIGLYNVGQQIRMQVPAAYGMPQMNGLLATIVAVDNTDNEFTIELIPDSSAFDAFVFPFNSGCSIYTCCDYPCWQAAMQPPYANLLDDATQRPSPDRYLS